MEKTKKYDVVCKDGRCHYVDSKGKEHGVVFATHWRWINPNGKHEVFSDEAEKDKALKFYRVDSRGKRRLVYFEARKP